MVIARLCYPASKLKTTDYLSKYQFMAVDVQVIYRYLDKLYNREKSLVQKISYNHTLKVLNHEISIVFYDVTTIYFEAESEDDHRKTGFSKDGKRRHPQIVLGLLVSKGGYPLLPLINAFEDRYKLNRLVIVADAGFLSGENVCIKSRK